MATVAHESIESAESAPDARTLCESFQATAAGHVDEVALRNEDGTVELTFGAYAEGMRRVAAGLASLGIRRGDTVALLLTNRPEFYLFDTAAVHLGATPFSIYNTSSAGQITYLFSNAENRVVVTEAQYLERVMEARGESPEPSTIVLVDGEAVGDGVITLDELESRGAEDFDFEAAWRAVEPGDVLTLIYTSGTTGPPKGVELTHANMLAECRAVGSVLPMRAGARITSYLPSAHIADRWSSHYNQMVFGFQITSVGDPRRIAEVLPSVRPTVWGAVPRVLEKLKSALEAGIAGEPDEPRRAGLQKAIEVGRQKVRLDEARKPIPDELARAHEQLDAQVLSKLREKIGLDQVEWLVVGAAPLGREVQEFLLAVGLPLTEVYGMSECSCCVTIAHPAEARSGTVGRPVPGVETRRAEDGELLVRGPVVMRGYRNEPEKTAEAIDSDGWLHTGDIVEVDDDGHIRVVDRKKELIISAGGKNMSPGNIEGELKSASPLIGQAVCIGDRRPYNVALVVLDPDAAASFAKAAGIGEGSVEALAADERVKQAIAEAVERANGELSRVEQIKRHKLLHDEWLPGSDELTPTMKLKRKPITEKYAREIEALYAG